MKTISGWDEMERYGIVPLTPEPDGLKYRIVCDVTAKGKRLIEKALGVAAIQLEAKWDYGTNDEPHVGAALLGPEILSMIGVYALLEDGCREVWTTKRLGLIGIQHGDSLQTVESMQFYYGSELVECFSDPTTVSNRKSRFLS